MSPSNIYLLKHMADEIAFVLSNTESKSKDQVTNDPILSRAVLRSLEIIGEVCSKLDSELSQNTRMLNGAKWLAPEID